MISKNTIKRINSLNSKKGREEHGCFVAEGKKTVVELISAGLGVEEVFRVSGLPGGQEDFGFMAPGCDVNEVTDDELKKISFLATPQQVLGVFKIPEHKLDVSSLKDRLSLVLDTIRDPGNLGTIIRIADWFGIENIICSTDTVDCYNPKVVQATMGSLARVKVHYRDLVKFFEEIKVKDQKSKAAPVYGALLEGENIYKGKLDEKGFIVLGNEANGISDKLSKYITHKISIPSFSAQQNKTTGGVGAESLNVAVAAAIICSEFRRTS